MSLAEEGGGGGSVATPMDKGVPADELGVLAAAPARRGPDWPVVVFGALLAALGAFAISEGARVSVRRVVYGLSPGGVPTVVGAGLAILAVLVMIQGFRGAFPERSRDAPGPVLWIVGGLVAQMALLGVAGFSVATGLVFAATAKAMGRGPLLFTVPLGIVVAFVIYLAFSQLLNLSLPAGPPEQAFLDLMRPAPAPAPAAPAP